MNDPEEVNNFAECFLDDLENLVETLWEESEDVLSDSIRCAVAANTCIRVASGIIMSQDGEKSDVIAFKKEWLQLCEKLFDQVYFEKQKEDKLTTNEVGDA